MFMILSCVSYSEILGHPWLPSYLSCDMPKKDLWVGTSDPDPAAIVGSAGSCDSMISNNSSSSEMVNFPLIFLFHVVLQGLRYFTTLIEEVAKIF